MDGPVHFYPLQNIHKRYFKIASYVYPFYQLPEKKLDFVFFCNLVFFF